LTAATSNVVLFDKSGRVIFSQAGTVSEARRKDLFAALGREIEP
jgi:predicted transcriptional regulator